MFFFFVWIIILGVLSFYEIVFDKKINKFIRNIFIFLLWFIYGFNRDNNDYKNYLIIFEKEEYVEKGYILLVKLVKIFSGNHNWIVLILSSLMIYVFFIRYKPKYPVTLIFIYSILNLIYDINQIRNFYAILFIYLVLKEKKKIIKIFYIFISIGFHSISIIYLLFFYLKKLSLKNFKWIGSIIFIFNFIGVEILQEIILYLFPSKGEHYLSLKPNLGWILYIIVLLIDILCLYFYKNNNKRNINLRKFIIFNLIFLPLGKLNIELVFRLYRNLTYIRLYYYLDILVLMNKKRRVIGWILLILPYLLINFANYIVNPMVSKEIFMQFKNIKFIF